MRLWWGLNKNHSTQVSKSLNATDAKGTNVKKLFFTLATIASLAPFALKSFIFVTI